MPFSIAIDGPAGAGKSTIARRTAKELNFIYVDTGAMYRAMALFFLRKGIAPAETAQIERLCGAAQITIAHRGGEQRVLLDGEDVTAQLREEAVGNMASATSVNGCVRERLVALQRELAAQTSVVMDGRDIGTVVLPQAQVKVYLTASVEVRAQRRFLELQKKGEPAELSAIAAQIAERDHRDMTREISPLRQAEDAVLVDTSAMTIDEVVAEILRLYREKQTAAAER